MRVVLTPQERSFSHRIENNFEDAEFEEYLIKTICCQNQEKLARSFGANSKCIWDIKKLWSYLINVGRRLFACELVWKAKRIQNHGEIPVILLRRRSNLIFTAPKSYSVSDRHNILWMDNLTPSEERSFSSIYFF